MSTNRISMVDTTASTTLRVGAIAGDQARVRYK